MNTLIIRADASSEIGAGHLMRCLALGQAWNDAGGKVVFITACAAEGLLKRLCKEGFDVCRLERSYPDDYDQKYTKSVLATYPGAWVVLDGYHFDEIYQQHVKESGHKLLVIDDMAHLKHYYADIVLNQNLHAGKLQYSCEAFTQLLLGTKYVLLRREFIAWKDWKREIPEVAQRVLVTLGGGDPDNHTLKAIQALQKGDVSGLEATVIIGATNRHKDKLETEVTRSSIPIRLVRNAENMSKLMAWGDVAVSAAGTTVWELMFMALPSLFLIVAENQFFAARALNHFGTVVIARSWDQMLFVYYLRKLLISMKLREHISALSRTVIDGFGAFRVADTIRHIPQSHSVMPKGSE